jgi:hypothetical protein
MEFIAFLGKERHASVTITHFCDNDFWETNHKMRQGIIDLDTFEPEVKETVMK